MAWGGLRWLGVAWVRDTGSSILGFPNVRLELRPIFADFDFSAPLISLIIAKRLGWNPPL